MKGTWYPRFTHEVGAASMAKREKPGEWGAWFEFAALLMDHWWEVFVFPTHHGTPRHIFNFSTSLSRRNITALTFVFLFY